MRHIRGKLRLENVAMLVLAASLLAACSGSEANETGTAQPSPVRATPITPATPSPMPASTATPSGEYDPTKAMYGIFSGADHVVETTLAALDDAIRHADVSQVPIIIEIMRFYRNLTLDGGYVDALLALTGTDFSVELRIWEAAMEWEGKNLDDYPPPAGYAEWKVNLLSQIDPRMGSFFAVDPSNVRINLTEAVWGGVRTDGIPDLLNPPNIGAVEASYLLPDDRIFGVSINGEHRAYPLRIVNAHEMANDRLGGEPISLAY